MRKYLLDGVESDRLKFRLLEETDFESWLPLFYEADVARFLGLDPSLTPKELCQKWFDKVLNRYENDLGGLNVLIDKQTGKFIGQCGLLVQTVENETFLEIGYSILPEYWGMGYATEAAIKAKVEAFQHNYADLLISIVHIENEGSATVARRNGMSLLKSMDDYIGMPIHMFGIHKNEWK
ncbi:MAG: ribosomal-protein-alanine N-acetyltransferase [Crocinitomix sp.]|jgi:ribosomal-protein-alanine N-acetyltransferase